MIIMIAPYVHTQSSDYLRAIRLTDTKGAVHPIIGSEVGVWYLRFSSMTQKIYWKLTEIQYEYKNGCDKIFVDVVKFQRETPLEYITETSRLDQTKTLFEGGGDMEAIGKFFQL